MVHAPVAIVGLVILADMANLLIAAPMPLLIVVVATRESVVNGEFVDVLPSDES